MKLVSSFLIFTFTVVISLPATASLIVLDRTNNHGFRKTDILKKENGIYFYNNFSLGKKLPADVLRAWQAFEKGPADEMYSLCSAGAYSFIKSDKNKKIQRKGCTQGDAYAALVKNVEVVREYAKERP